MSTELINCNDLSIGYGTDIVQSHISFKINQGDYVCVIGENGAGKSTLIKTILGLIKPLSGEIIISNILQNSIGYLPQQNDAQKNFPTTVFEVVLSGNQNNHKLFYSKHDKAKALETILNLGIGDLLKKSFNELSGGQRQKVLLARALCVSKDLLILDEPVTGLDINSQNEFYEMIHHINRMYATTIIMISHDNNAIQESISHVLKVSKEDTILYDVEDYRRGI